MVQKKWIFAYIVCLLMVALVACGGKELSGNTENAASETKAEEPKVTTEPMQENTNVTIRMTYGELQIAPEYADSCRHMEVTEGNMTMEVFYMLCENGEKELFRIYFGAKEMGNLIGFLDMNELDIPISVAVCSYNPEDFSGEEEFELYNYLMLELNTVINSIQMHSQFREYGAVETTIPKTTDVDLFYWNVMLPETMEMEETVYASCYQADFYGTVAGERICFYTVYLGETDADTLLGTFAVDGEVRPVYVESYDLDPRENWTEEDTVAAYSMMSTINDVLQTIISDPNFSEEIPE